MVPLAPAGHRGAGHAEPHRDQHLPHREDQGGRHEQHHCARCSLLSPICLLPLRSPPLVFFFTLFPFPSFCVCRCRWLTLMMDVALMQVQDVGAEKDAITSLRAPTHYGRPNWDRVFSSIAEKHPETDVGVVRAPSLRACPCPASPNARVRVRVRAPVLLRPGRAVEAAAHLLQQVLDAERHQVLLRKRCVGASLCAGALLTLVLVLILLPVLRREFLSAVALRCWARRCGDAGCGCGPADPCVYRYCVVVVRERAPDACSTRLSFCISGHGRRQRCYGVMGLTYPRRTRGNEGHRIQTQVCVARSPATAILGRGCGSHSRSRARSPS